MRKNTKVNLTVKSAYTLAIFNFLVFTFQLVALSHILRTIT
jgi:hypothetical protein